MVSLIAPETFGRPSPDQTNEVTPVGTGSDTLTFVAVNGPEFDTVIVYVTDVPGVTLPTLRVTELPPWLSTLVTPTSLPDAVTALDALDAGPVPRAFVAATLNV